MKSVSVYSFSIHLYNFQKQLFYLSHLRTDPPTSKISHSKRRPSLLKKTTLFQEINISVMKRSVRQQARSVCECSTVYYQLIIRKTSLGAIIHTLQGIMFLIGLQFQTNHNYCGFNGLSSAATGMFIGQE
jgi:hypothetical protein